MSNLNTRLNNKPSKNVNNPIYLFKKIHHEHFFLFKNSLFLQLQKITLKKITHHFKGKHRIAINQHIAFIQCSSPGCEKMRGKVGCGERCRMHLSITLQTGWSFNNQIRRTSSPKRWVPPWL